MDTEILPIKKRGVILASQTNTKFKVWKCIENTYQKVEVEPDFIFSNISEGYSYQAECHLKYDNFFISINSGPHSKTPFCFLIDIEGEKYLVECAQTKTKPRNDRYVVSAKKSNGCFEISKKFKGFKIDDLEGLHKKEPLNVNGSSKAQGILLSPIIVDQVLSFRNDPNFMKIMIEDIIYELQKNELNEEMIKKHCRKIMKSVIILKQIQKKI